MPTSPHVLTTGTDPAAWRAHQATLAAATADGYLIERIELDTPDGTALLDAALASAGGLFGGGRCVDLRGLDTLDTAAAKRLAGRAADSDTRVCAYQPSGVTAHVKRALREVFELVEFATPKAAGLPTRVKQLAADHGLRLDAAAVRLAATRSGHDLARLDQLLHACAQAGLVKLDARQLGLLLGTSEAPGAVWSITDRIEAGDVDGAVAAAGGLEPQAALAWLVKRSVTLAQAAEIAADGGDISELGLPGWQAQRVARAAGDDPAARWQALVDAAAALASARGEVPADQALTAAVAAAARHQRR